jgi:hypothetical protein
MIVAAVNTGFIKHLSTVEMHNNSKEWLLDLEFLNDEYLFFEDLIKWNTLQLIDFQAYSKSKEIVESFSSAKTNNDKIIALVKKHENKLEILLSGINHQKVEQAYREEHTTLFVLFKNHLKEHRILKLKLFDVLKKIKRAEKQKRLIDVE